MGRDSSDAKRGHRQLDAGRGAEHRLGLLGEIGEGFQRRRVRVDLRERVVLELLLVVSQALEGICEGILVLQFLRPAPVLDFGFEFGEFAFLARLLIGTVKRVVQIVDFDADDVQRGFLRDDGLKVCDVLLAQGEDTFEARGGVEVALDEVSVVDQGLQRGAIFPSQRAVGVAGRVGDHFRDRCLAGAIGAEEEVEPRESAERLRRIAIGRGHCDVQRFDHELRGFPKSDEKQCYNGRCRKS